MIRVAFYFDGDGRAVAEVEGDTPVRLEALEFSAGSVVATFDDEDAGMLLSTLVDALNGGK